MLMAPELIIIATAFLVLFADLMVEERRRSILAFLALAGLGLACASVIWLMPREGAMLGGRFAVDAVSWWFKLLFLGAGAMTVAISMDALDGRAAVPTGLGSRGEYYTILLFTVSGMMFLASAAELVTLYVSL